MTLSFSLAVKAKTMLQELPSLGGGTITHRASPERGCFHDLHSLSVFLRRLSSASSFQAKQLPSPQPSTFLPGKQRQSRGPLLSTTYLIHCGETSQPSRHTAVTNLVLRAGQQRLVTWHSGQGYRHSPSLHSNCFPECTQRQAAPLKRDNSEKELFK